MARAVAIATLLLWGCARASSGSSSQDAPPRAPAPQPARVESAPAPPTLELEPVEAASPGTVDIVEPRSGQVLSELDAAKTAVRVQSDHHDFVLEVGLDGARARPLATLSATPTLGDLAPRLPLARGDHFLVAALRRDEAAPARFAIRRFSVGQSARSAAAADAIGQSARSAAAADAIGQSARSAAAADATGQSAHSAAAGAIVYCGRPAGTYYSAPGAPLLLDFAIDGFELGARGALLVRASELPSGVNTREALLRDAAPRQMKGFGARDFRIELVLLDAAGKPLTAPFARAECALTVNEVASP